MYSVLAVVFLASALPAEASRKAAVRPPADLAVAAPAVDPTDAGEPATGVSEPGQPAPEPAVEKAPRRGFFEILFGRKSPAKAEVLTGVDEPTMDERMLDAVRLAERSARRRSINRCWRFVKRALKEADLVECYPKTALAKEAAVELPERYGFKQIEVDNPHDAPVGAVIVYGGRGAGHVELRSETGFVSDHASHKPSPRPMIGVFIKPVELVEPLEG